MALENARLFRRAEELNRLKDEFLATLSHELRTPLLGGARVVADARRPVSSMPRKTKQAIEAIERNAQAQAKIVDDILDVARGMGGNVRLDVKPVDLAAVAHRGGGSAWRRRRSASRFEIDLRAPAAGCHSSAIRIGCSRWCGT